MRIEYQHWGILADGRLGFAGCSHHQRMSLGTARRIYGKWVAWARLYVAENPGEYPLAVTVRALPTNPVKEIRMHPVGHPEQCQSFILGVPSGQAT